MERYLDLLRFDGRLSRLAYWKAYLLLSIAISATLIVGYSAIIAVGAAGAALLLPVLPILWASVAIVSRRLHDRERSAWWIIPIVVAPLVLPGALQESHTTSVLLLLSGSLLSLALGVWGLIEIGFRRGTQGPNRYGADPQTS